MNASSFSPAVVPGKVHHDSLEARLARLIDHSSADRESVDGKQVVLAARARALAVPRVEQVNAAADDRISVLIFLVGNDRMAMPVLSVVAIILATTVTPLPRAVAPVYGVTAWRGRPLTVLSIGAAQRSARTEGSRLIVLGDGRRAIAGLMADDVEETRLVARAGMMPPRGGPRAELALGMTDDAILVLDADALLTAARPEP